MEVPDMKILHVADLHLDHGWFDWIASNCSAFDLLVIAGDLQNAFSNSGMHDQARAVTKWLLGLPTPTIVCSGNHDFWVGAQRGPFDVMAEAGWLKNLQLRGNIIGVDGETIEFGGLTIAVNGWLQTPPEDCRADIVVTHAPPSGCACAGDTHGHDNGDPEIWHSIHGHPPRLLLCGHIHAPRKFSCSWPQTDPITVVLVPGCDERSDIPDHWIIDTSAKIAKHSRGDGCEVFGPDPLDR